MNNIGDVKRGIEIGLNTTHKHIWRACPDCGKEQWVMIKNGKPQTKRCASCAGKESAKIRIHSGDKHWHWKGGRQITKLGYVEVKLLPDSPYYSMAGKDGYIYEHRLIMAQHLGRCLEKGEEVHHANGIKHDNRFENFELNSKSEHNRLYHSDMKRLLLRISELETKVRELSQ